jgi:malate/lactate dehydrogenase
VVLVEDADDYEEISGSKVVVVVTTGADGGEIRVRSPEAVVVVVADPVAETCRSLYDATLFPPERVIGIPDSAATLEAVEAILFDRNREVTCVALCGDEFVAVRAKLGCHGIDEVAPV